MKPFVFAAAICAAACLATPASQALAPFTNRLAVELRYVTDPAGFAAHMPRFSRDRSRYAFVSRQPRIASGAIEYQLYSLETDAALRYLSGDVAQVPPAKLLATFRSRSARPAITQVKWLNDNKTLAFLAESEDGKTALYSVDVFTAKLNRLVSHPTRIRTFDTDGSTVVFIAEVEAPPRSPDEMITVTDQWLGEVLKPAGAVGLFYPPPDALYKTFIVARPGSAAVEVPRSVGRKFVHVVGSASDFGRKIWLSPDSARAVELRYTRGVPRTWERLAASKGRLAATDGDVGESGVPFGAFRYVVIDLRTGELLYDMGAPTGVNTFSGSPFNALWAKDSNSVVLTNTFAAEDVAEGKQDPPRPAIVDVDLSSRRQSVVLRMRPYSANQDGSLVHADRVNDGRLEVVEFPGFVFTKTTPEARVFERTARGEWREESKAPYSVPFWVRRTEDPNPMEYVGVLGPEGTAKPIFKTNPELEGVEIVPAETFVWQDSHGESWRAVLLVPERCRLEGNCPLVVQTHGYTPRFLADGPVVYANTAYAARALASEGFMVMQMQDHVELQDGPTEAERYLDAYRTAISGLKEKYRIDASRVGAVGFSRTCYHVKYASAFAPELFRAAVVADGVDFGYSQYLFTLPGPARNMMGIHTVAHAIYGSNPFAEGREAWLAKAPAFNVQRVSAAFLVQATGESSLYGEWEFFAGLRALGKPTELHYFRDSEHPLIRPGPRYESAELTKDWMTFWLMGREDPDPAKAAQYERWRKMRAAQMRSR